MELPGSVPKPIISTTRSPPSVLRRGLGVLDRIDLFKCHISGSIAFKCNANVLGSYSNTDVLAVHV